MIGLISVRALTGGLVAEVSVTEWSGERSYSAVLVRGECEVWRLDGMKSESGAKRATYKVGRDSFGAKPAGKWRNV